MMNWYDTLIKPPLTPPDYIFIITWSILYLLMAISFFMILNSKKENKKYALTIFFIQFVLNLIWSPLFFYLQRIDLAFIDIIALWVSIALMILSFSSHSKIAAFLQIPYFLWVSFAVYLNLGFLILN